MEVGQSFRMHAFTLLVSWLCWAGRGMSPYIVWVWAIHLYPTSRVSPIISRDPNLGKYMEILTYWYQPSYNHNQYALKILNCMAADYLRDSPLTSFSYKDLTKTKKSVASYYSSIRFLEKSFYVGNSRHSH
jgi:hypothetical protein